MDETSDMKKMLILSPGLFGQDHTQMSQVQNLLPLLLLDDDENDDKTKVWEKKLLVIWDS